MENIEGISDSYFKGGSSVSDDIKRIVKRIVGFQGCGDLQAREQWAKARWD